MIRIDIDEQRLNEIRSMVSGIHNGYPKILTRALNDTAKTVKTQAALRVGNELNLTAARIKKDMSIDKATYSKLSAAVKTKSRSPGLINFGAKKLSGNKGVSFKKFRSGAREKKSRAFIATGRNSNEHVFIRRWTRAHSPISHIGRRYGAFLDRKYRAPIETEYGPRVSSILNTPRVIDPVQQQAAFVFSQNVERELDAVLRGF